MVMAALGAFYLLARKHTEFARICLSSAWSSAWSSPLTQVFPTGSKNGEMVVKYQPTTLAAMEGQFKTEPGAPLAIIGMPDTQKGSLLDPVEVPGLLSYLAYGNFSAPVKGLNDIPRDLWPPVEVVYYAYHIMITLGGYFIALMALGVFLLWRRRLETSALVPVDSDAVPAVPLHRQRGRLGGDVRRAPALDHLRRHAHDGRAIRPTSRRARRSSP